MPIDIDKLTAFKELFLAVSRDCADLEKSTHGNMYICPATQKYWLDFFVEQCENYVGNDQQQTEET